MTVAVLLFLLQVEQVAHNAHVRSEGRPYVLAVRFSSALATHA